MTVIYNNILIVLPRINFNEEEFLAVKSTFESRGIKLFIASDSNGLCTGESGLKVKADVKLFNIHEANFPGIIFIGGKGVKEYWSNQLLHDISKKFFEARKPVAAICSAPVILARAGLLKDIAATCYPDDRKELEKAGAEYKDTSVVIRKKIITARDERSAPEFSLAIVEAIGL